MVSFSALFRTNKTPKTDSTEKKQFTQPEKIKVPALYNSHEIKKRLSFTVEADVIMVESKIKSDMAVNDPLTKVGVIAKPSESVKEMVSPFDGQTWHKKSTPAKGTPVKSSSAPPCVRGQSAAASRTGSSLHVSFSGKPASAPAVGCSSSHTPVKRAAGTGIRNMYALEQALQALEEIEAEIHELKEVMCDSSNYSADSRLSKALAKLAANKQSLLKEKLEMIYFAGEDSHLLEKLKAKLLKTLDAMSNDWSSGGLMINSDCSPQKVISGNESPLGLR